MTSLDARRERVRNGSRRKRDLRAVAEATRSAHEQVISRITSTESALAAWTEAREELRRSLPPSTFGIWLSSLVAMGEADGRLYLTAPCRTFTWVERRYKPLIESALASVTPYRAVVIIAEPAGDGAERRQVEEAVG